MSISRINVDFYKWLNPLLISSRHLLKMTRNEAAVDRSYKLMAERILFYPEELNLFGSC